jgi:type I restriction-modification system DNA methylase subunit
VKLGRHKIKQFKREDIVLHLYGEEIEESATLACDGIRGGFRWINARSAIIENKFKPNTEHAFTEEEIRKIDNEVQRWNERELPPSIQAK